MSNQHKRVCYILFVAFVCSVCIFEALVHLLAVSPAKTSRPPDPTALRPIMYGIACLFLLAAVWGSFKLSYAPTPARFQTGLVLALALAEAGSIMGLLLFLLGGPAGEFARFLIATIVVDLVFILPQIVRQ